MKSRRPIRYIIAAALAGLLALLYPNAAGVLERAQEILKSAENLLVVNPAEDSTSPAVSPK